MLLSVIIPVYNGEKYVARCLDSILCQNLLDYEILVIDDGSTDGTASVVEKYVLLHPNIIKLLHQKNSGQGVARNKGIIEAKGEYLSFIDADDYIEPNSYPFLLSQMKDRNLDLLCCNYKKVDTEGNKLPKKKIELVTKYPLKGVVVTTAADFLYSYFGSLCYTWLFIYRKNFVISTGLLFKPKIYMEDTEWLAKLFTKSTTIGITSYIFYNYVQTTQSSMRNTNEHYVKKRIDDSFYVIQLLYEYEKNIHDSKIKKWFMETRSTLQIILFHQAMNIRYKTYKEYICRKLMELKYPIYIRRIPVYKFTALCLNFNWRFSVILYGQIFKIVNILKLKH